jgi:hypothetical protein
MKLSLREQLTQFGHLLQSALFPVLEMQLGELTESARRLVATLEMIPLTRFIPACRGWMGRPSKDRDAIARGFIAKAVYGFSTTRQLLEALQRDAQLLRICGWEEARQVPHESTFSRAFEEFAQMELPQFVHEALIRETQQDRVIGHVARDSTAIEARERYPETPDKPNQSEPAQTVPPQEVLLELAPPSPSPPVAAAEVPAASAPRKRGRKPGQHGAHKRWKGGKPRRKAPAGTRLARQRTMSLPEMLADLPQECNMGAKMLAITRNRSFLEISRQARDGIVKLQAKVVEITIG